MAGPAREGNQAELSPATREMRENLAAGEMEKEKVPPPEPCLTERGLQRARLRIARDAIPTADPTPRPSLHPPGHGADVSPGSAAPGGELAPTQRASWTGSLPETREVGEPERRQKLEVSVSAEIWHLPPLWQPH